MNPVKYFWAARAIVYKLIFKRFGNISYMGKPVFVEGGKNISVGNRVRIFPGLRIQTLERGNIIIGDNVCIEQNVHIISAKDNLFIGSDVVISANVFISNCDHDYKDIEKSVIEQPNIVKTTQIGEGSFIGYGSVIMPGTVLGKHCIVGANSVTKGKFPDYSVIAGTPAKIIKIYNKGEKLWARKL